MLPSQSVGLAKVSKKWICFFVVAMLVIVPGYSSASVETEGFLADQANAPVSGSLMLIGSNIELSSGLTTQRRSPYVAYNGVDNEYIVVWFDTRNPGNNDVFGQRVSATGALLGANMPIIEFAEAQVDPFVLHNSIDNEYLVAWKTQQPGFFNDARGRRVSSSGTLLGSDFFIADGGDEISGVYNPMKNEYLMTGRGLGIWGRRVSNIGSLLGGAIKIATTGAPAPNGQAAYNPNANEYLATWRDQMNLKLLGQRVSTDGALVGSPITISPLFPESGRPTASVAFDTVNDRYLVIFGVFQEMEILGQFVSSSGVLLGEQFSIASGLTSRAVPNAVYSSAHSAFVVVWREGADIVGQLLSHDGSPTGDTLVIASGTASGNPTLAYNTTTGQLLVVWSDNRNLSQGEEDIFAQLVGITDIGSVDIDIKPGSDPNSINCKNEKGVIPVAILTTDEFDATTVDHTTVTFEGASETHVKKKTGEPRRHKEDVDGDGDKDLVFHFRLGDTDLTCESTEGTLIGQTFDGQAIEGTDFVRMVKR